MVKHLVVVEDINLKAISSHKSKYHLGKATNDNGYGMYVKMLEYKLNKSGGILIKADKFFASTQICNCYGYKNSELKDLSIREWTCPECETVHDRDVNAAKNVLKRGIFEEGKMGICKTYLKKSDAEN